MLINCRTQASLVSKIFHPDMDAMTAFVNKVFEDSIAEYLSAVLSTAKERREGSAIYLHTLATAVHCCMQFLEYIQAADPDVAVHTEKVGLAIKLIFGPYISDYMDIELDYLKKRCDIELSKWNSRVCNMCIFSLLMIFFKKLSFICS